MSGRLVRHRMRRFGFRTALYLTLLTAGVLWGAPLLWMAVTSIKPEAEIFRVPLRWWPSHPTGEYFPAVFQRFPMLGWFRNSTVVAVITTVLTVAVDALAAYPLARLRFPGRRLILATILATFLLPYELLFVPLFLGLNVFGIADSIFSLAVPPSANALGVFLLVRFFETIPRELEEAAALDGCSRFGFFWRVLLPLSRPGLVTVAIFAFVGSWNNFFWPLIVSSSEDTRTLPVGLATMVGSGMSMRQGVLMGAAVIATVPAVLFFLLLQRYFVQGVASTGVKG